jgi:YbbR domain-containing protein
MESKRRNILGLLLGWLKVVVHSLGEIKDSKNPFFKNLGKKILAIAIAIALWFVANIEHDIEKSIPIGVNYVNLSPELVIVNKPPEKLNVRIRGPRTQLSSLSTRDIVFTLDLANVSPGISRFEIQTDQIKTPRGVLVTGISPAEIEIEVDKLKQKEVSVKPVVGLPDDGYEIVGKPRVVPSKVEVKGPKSIVSKIESVSTDLVSATGVKTTFTTQVPLRVPHPLVKIIGDEIVQVTVTIKEIRVVKEFKGISIDFVNFDNISFEPMGLLKVDLEFEGPYSIIKNLNSNDIQVFVDGSNIKKSGKRIETLKVNVNYPHKEGLVLKKKMPNTVEIRLN